ncbi:MAG: hypothetical protein KBC15_00695 [Candidatus Levybacteria bacterium]|nr:hypothetical protein [Candidatus Levybacteria bacterium]
MKVFKFIIFFLAFFFVQFISRAHAQVNCISYLYCTYSNADPRVWGCMCFDSGPPGGRAPNQCLSNADSNAICRPPAPNPCAQYCSDSYSVAETCNVGCGSYCGVNCFVPTATPIPPTPTPIPPDFDVTDISPRDNTGVKPSYFKVGDRVYPHIVVRNNAAVSSWLTYYTRIYQDQDDRNNNYTTATMGSPFSAGSSRTYEAWNGGTNQAQLTSPKSFLLTGAGRYTMLARANYANAGSESNYSNNEMGVGYNVRAHVESYVCNDKGENGQCKNTGDRSKKDITITLDENVTSESGFETHIKSVATAADGYADFDYRMDGHYRMMLSDAEANDGWKTIGVKNGSAAWTTGTTCVTNLSPDWTCEFAVVPLHKLTGTIFVDNNRNGIKEADETDGMNDITVTASGPTDKTTTTNSQGVYNFNNMRAGAYTISIAVPTGYVAFPSSTITVSPAASVGLDGPTTFTENIGINEVCTLTGRVYVDSDKNGSYDSTKDFPIAGRRVFTTGQDEKEATTASDGRYSIQNLSPGNYFVDVSKPNGYVNLDTAPRQLTITNCASVPGQNFKLFGAYTIKGNAFLDTNGDKLKASNGAELNIAANPNVSIQDIAGRPKAYKVNNNDGTYSMENLINGTYTVRYGGLPNGFYMVHPQNTTPPSFSATVGSGCAPGTPTPGGQCNGLSLEDLDFAVDAGQSWIQTGGLDIRMDGGINNPVPASPNAACGGAYTLVPGTGSAPGIAFSGATTASFHSGSASSTNWVIGSNNYKEIFTAHNSSGSETSYAYFQSVIRQSNITPINLTTVCPNLSSCTLPNTLANGVYQANGDVTLTGTSSLPANRDFVILINGELRIAGDVDVPNTSTATFSVADDISVASTVGRAASCPAPANANIDGFISTDKNFIIETAADCTLGTPDLQLNMQGSIAVNAARTGGSFQNNRTLCDSGNLQYPSFTINDRPDMILNAPEFLRIPTYIWQEVAPN